MDHSEFERGVVDSMSRRSGYTLLELILVIGLIGLAAALQILAAS